MLELLFNVYNISSYLNENSFKLYIFWNFWTYYYWFINTDNSKIFTLNIEYSTNFRDEVSVLIEPWKVFPYRDKDRILVSYNWDELISMLLRWTNSRIFELETKKLSINWLDFFNMVKS
jgi:hypothetical protein